MLSIRVAPSGPERPGTLAAPPAVSPRWLFGGQAALGSVVVLAGAALPFLAADRDEAPLWMAGVLAGVLVATGAATLWACRRRATFAAALAPAVGCAAGYLFAASFLYPALEARKSARPFSEQVAALTADSRAAGHEVVAYELGNLPEAFAFHGDGLYTVETLDPGRLGEHLRQPDEVWAVVDRDRLDRLPADVREEVEIVEETRLSRTNVALVKSSR